MTCKKTPSCSYKDLTKYHSEDYVSFLRSLSSTNSNKRERLDAEKDDDEEEKEEQLDEYGLLDQDIDYSQIWDHVTAVGGCSLFAASQLMRSGGGKSSVVDVAIAYTGGRHHAKKSAGNGYCYVNDIVLAILKLREEFPKVLYVDIDAHHCDGVEDAFSYSSNVRSRPPAPIYNECYHIIPSLT